MLTLILILEQKYGNLESELEKTGFGTLPVCARENGNIYPLIDLGNHVISLVGYEGRCSDAVSTLMDLANHVHNSMVQTHICVNEIAVDVGGVK